MHVDRFHILLEASKNLNEIHYANILKLVHEINLSNIIGFPLPKNSEIYRIRFSEEIPFTNKSQISYNPKTGNFGRANKPHQPIFYGSLRLPNALDPIKTNIYEVFHIIKNSNKAIIDNSIELTCGRWRVKESFTVIPIVFYEPYSKKHELFKPIYDQFRRENSNNQRNIEIINFIAQEFAKEDVKSPLEYQISAAFAEMTFNSFKDSIEGIIYPSTRTNGDGFNIAITPNFVEKFLRLESVAIMKLKFKDGSWLIDIEKETNNISPDGLYFFESTSN